MSIRKRENKKAKNGYVYEVYFNYYENGIKTRCSKSGFKTKKEAQKHEALKLAEIQENGKLKKDVKETFYQVFFEFLEVGSSQYQANTIYNTRKDHKYFKDSIGKMNITAIDYSVLQGFFNNRNEEGIEANRNKKNL